MSEAKALVLTMHAQKRMAQMQVTGEQVEELRRNPLTTYRSDQYDRGMLFRNRRIAIVVDIDSDPQHDIVITVLWVDPQDYGRLSPGRKATRTLGAG